MQGAAILFSRSIAGLLICICLLTPAVVGQAVKSPDFTIIALPDPQMYSEYYPETFQQQTAWVAAHRDDLNIKFVIGLGDNVNDGDSETQWKNAALAMKALDEASVPYAMAIGNHDYMHSKPPTRSAPLFNKYFGKSHYTGRPWYGDSTYPAGTSENFFVTLSIEGKNYLLLFLEYFPRPAAVAWAKTVLDRHQDQKVIVITHALEGSDAFRNGRCDYNGPAAEGLESNTLNGDEVWEALISQYSNIFLVLNGHVNGAAHETDFGKHGNAVTQILADYQDDTDGGGGFLRILTFKPTEHKIVISTYSPSSQAYKADEQNSFSVPYDNAGLDSKLAGFRGRVRSNECDSISNAVLTFTKGSERERVFTDADGYFTSSRSLEPGFYRVLASAPGFESAWTGVEVKAGFLTPVRLYLPKADREFKLKVPDSSVVRAGASVSVPIDVTRTPGFAAPLQFSAFGTPDGITATFKTIQRKTTLTITVDGKVAPGKYKFFVDASTRAMERVAPVELTVSAEQP